VYAPIRCNAIIERREQRNNGAYKTVAVACHGTTLPITYPLKLLTVTDALLEAISTADLMRMKANEPFPFTALRWP
jgi:hypothetical protein